MPAPVLSAIGGLGLFILGMRIMTEGLRMLADGRLHRWLARVTRTPFSGAATGMLCTAAIQSSSATTVAAVGFVGAGVLTFEQALGVIFGANIGSTVTGWLVATFGFTVRLGSISLLLVFCGALLMLLGKGSWAKTGRVLAGFALMFLGLDLLKDGLAAAAHGISLGQFRSATISGRLVLVGIGVVLTIITQSSSATVATALAAMSSGVIDLPQALAVVIGADMGTTAAAWLASAGGTTDSRRTGLSHVVFNLLTGLGAFLLLPVYYGGLGRFLPGMEAANPQFAAVAFHSAFNILGVLAILPFTRRFARMMRWLVPERSPSPSAALDPRLVETPAAAVETLHHATGETAALALACLEDALDKPPKPTPGERLDFIERSTRECRGFVGHLSPASSEPVVQARLPAILHALDHIERLLDRCRDHERIESLAGILSLAEETRQVRDGCRILRLALLSKGERPYPIDLLEKLALSMESDHYATRHQFIESTARGERDPDELGRDLDAHRWLRRVSWHIYRICHYFAGTVSQPATTRAARS
jgi:phosphate:Na+ symporter